MSTRAREEASFSPSDEQRDLVASSHTAGAGLACNAEAIDGILLVFARLPDPFRRGSGIGVGWFEGHLFFSSWLGCRVLVKGGTDKGPPLQAF